MRHAEEFERQLDVRSAIKEYEVIYVGLSLDCTSPHRSDLFKTAIRLLSRLDTRKAIF